MVLLTIWMRSPGDGIGVAFWLIVVVIGFVGPDVVRPFRLAGCRAKGGGSILKFVLSLRRCTSCLRGLRRTVPVWGIIDP